MLTSKLCWYHPTSVGVPDNLKCTNPDIDKFESGRPLCQSGCTMYQKCKRAFEQGRFPDAFWDMPADFRNPPEDFSTMRLISTVIRSIESFVNNGQNLYIHSDICGNGKTFRAVSIAKAYIRCKAAGKRYSDKWVSYLSVPQVVSEYDICDKMSYENENRAVMLSRLNNLNSCDLVVWDDFGFNSGAYVESVILRSALMYRLSCKLSNIIVSAYSLQELRDLLSRSDFQRLSSSTIDVELLSSDFRNNSLI